jgi:hydrogenase nickel incorporation protein HypA/HybF
MHEMSIAVEILRTVERVAAEHGAVAVDRIELEVGAMRMIVPEAIRMAWSVAAEGTVAEGAELAVTEVPLKGRCRGCGMEFAPTIETYLCPGCEKADVEIVGGNEILLRSVVCRGADEEGAEGS